MTKTKFLATAAATIAAAGLIGAAIAQNTPPSAAPAAPADSPATPAVPATPGAPSTGSDSSSSGAGSMNTDTAAKSDRG